MKKLFVLMLALMMAGLASAGIINVVQDNGRSGNVGLGDGFVNPSDIVAIKIVLSAGYYMSYYDLDLHVTGPGVLGSYICSFSYVNEDGDTVTDSRLGPGASYEPGNHIDDTAQGGFWVFSGIAGNNIAQMMDGRVSGWWGSSSSARDMVWALNIHCEGAGDVLVDLTLHGDTQVKQGSGGTPFLITNDNLGDLVIHQIPEPATVALLCLGGLLLRKK